MEQSDFLTTAAQIAVGLAGFTGVASVFGSGPTAGPDAVQSERLRAMIEAALVAVVFSMVPLLLDEIGMGVEMMWRLACGLFSVGWTAAFIVTVRRGLRVLREVGVQADASWRMLVGVMGASSFGALVVGTLGVRSSALYLLALLLQLVMCAMYFYRFFVGIHNRAPATRS